MTESFIVVGTRPEAIKLAPVILALRARGAKPIVCLTGQHRELAADALGWFGLSADLTLGPHPAGLDEMIASLLTRLGQAMDAVRPDRVVVQGDTASAFAGALAAHNRGLPVAHVEAGLRTGDLAAPWPEEGHRKLIAALADLHFAPTPAAAAALRAENIAPGAIRVTGNTGIDALHSILRQSGAPPPAMGAKKLVLATCHRRESLGEGFRQIAAALAVLARRTDATVALTLHPNPAVRSTFTDLPGVRLLDPLPYPDFIRLLATAHLALTDSGGVQEEAPALGIPLLVMRDATERPEGVTAGTARLVGRCRDRIVAEACLLLDDPRRHAAMRRAHSPYGDGRAAERIAAMLLEQRKQPAQRRAPASPEPGQTRTAPTPTGTGHIVTHLLTSRV